MVPGGYFECHVYSDTPTANLNTFKIGKNCRFFNVAAFGWNRCYNLNGRIVDRCSCWEENMHQFSLFRVDRNSTFSCPRIPFDDEIIVLNKDNQTNGTPQGTSVKRSCSIPSGLNSICYDVDSAAIVSIHLFFMWLLHWIYNGFHCVYHGQMIFSILLHVYLLEFLLQRIYMSIIETTVRMYNVIQIMKKQQFFGVCQLCHSYLEILKHLLSPCYLRNMLATSFCKFCIKF